MPPAVDASRASASAAASPVASRSAVTAVRAASRARHSGDDATASASSRSAGGSEARASVSLARADVCLFAISGDSPERSFPRNASIPITAARRWAMACVARSILAPSADDAYAASARSSACVSGSRVGACSLRTPSARARRRDARLAVRYCKTDCSSHDAKASGSMCAARAWPSHARYDRSASSPCDTLTREPWVRERVSESITSSSFSAEARAASGRLAAVVVVRAALGSRLVPRGFRGFGRRDGGRAAFGTLVKSRRLAHMWPQARGARRRGEE